MTKHGVSAALALVGAALFGVAQAQASTLSWDFAGGGALGTPTQSYTSASGGVSISATGYLNYNTANTFGGTTNLYGKGTKGSTSGDENGLGLANATNDEIWRTEFIRINFTNAVSNVSDFMFSMNSSTLNTTGDQEAWTVYGSDSATSLGTALLTGTGETLEKITGHVYDYYSFVVSSYIAVAPTKPSPDCTKTKCTTAQRTAWNNYQTQLTAYNKHINDNVLLHTISADLASVIGGGGSTVPLPAAFSLFAGGLGVLGFFGRRRKRRV